MRAYLLCIICSIGIAVAQNAQGPNRQPTGTADDDVEASPTEEVEVAPSPTESTGCVGLNHFLLSIRRLTRSWWRGLNRFYMWTTGIVLVA